MESSVSNTVVSPFFRVMVDQQYLLDKLAGLRHEWEIATSGEMSKVTLDLAMLFDDLANLISLNQAESEESA